VLPSEMEAIDLHLSKAPNFGEGGSYSPSSAVDIGGSSKLKVDAPVVARDVANKAYVDQGLAFSLRVAPELTTVNTWAPLYDTTIGALHLANFVSVQSTYGKTKLRTSMDFLPDLDAGSDPGAHRVTIAQDPSSGRILVGRGADDDADVGKILVSTNRKSWVDVGGGILTSNQSPAFVWWTGNEFLVFYAEAGSASVYTYDGLTLSNTGTTVYSSSDETHVFHAAFSPTTAVVIRRGSVGIRASLSDLATWSPASLPGGTVPYDITYSTKLGKFVVVGRNSSGPCMLTSPDGATWTAVTIGDPWPITGTDGILVSVCERFDRLVGVFYSENDFTDPTAGLSFIGMSDDGVSWQMTDTIGDLIEMVRPAPTGIVAVGHPSSASGVFVSG
jgi:hypothetical protein